MDVDILQRHFARMGARVVVEPGPVSWHLGLDVRRDARGEYFEIRAGQEIDVAVTDLRPRERHALVLARNVRTGVKDKFLCGHDERAWFVAAVPNDPGVASVPAAMEALKPREVREVQERLGVAPRERARRRNAAYLRQGEWFFIPAPHRVFEPALIHRHEILSRGTGSKPHVAEEAVRTAGEVVYVSRLAPMGLTQEQYKALLDRDPKARKVSWRTARRDADVYVRGRIRHPDHATIVLPYWHLVRMNTEHRSRAMAHVVFVD